MFIPFLLSTLAGLSTMIGSIVIFFKKSNYLKVIVGSLSFAASVMLIVSFIDLIPESLTLLLKNITLFPSIIILLICMNIGVILGFSINKYFPTNIETNDKLYKVGIISMLAIILHNIPEGIATFMASNTNLKLGISMTIAIALHNIPEGITISVPIYYSTKSKKKALLYTFISGISELFGAIITYLFLKPFINDFILGMIFALIAGIMTYISLAELLPESLRYNKKRITSFYFLLGIIFVIISHFFF